MEHRDDESCEQESALRPRTAWRARSDRELIVAMRADISAAFDEFVARYQPLLLARSRRFDLPQWEREDCVADVLESMMLRLLKPETRAPKEMAAYLVRVLHNRLVDVSRTRGGREAARHGVADSGDVGVERLVAAPDTPDLTVPELSPALQRLAQALVGPLTDEERQLIGWESNMIPHRTIAAWLGVSHAAATKRIWRLRARLREVALRYSASLAPAEQREIMRVINRNEAAESGRGSEAARGVSLEGRRVLRRRAGQSGQGGTGG